MTGRRFLSPAEAARKAANREARRVAALAAMAEWPQGLPPLCGLGWDVGLLIGLEKDGLAVRRPRDALGDLRFEITDEGRSYEPEHHLRRAG